MILERFPIIPVIELRNPKLLCPGLLELLRAQNLTLCYNDAFLAPDQWPEPLDTVYLRLRSSPYCGEFFLKFAKQLIQWSNQGKECYVFFKHEEGAPQLAQRMLAVLTEPEL